MFALARFIKSKEYIKYVSNERIKLALSFVVFKFIYVFVG